MLKAIVDMKIDLAGHNETLLPIHLPQHFRMYPLKSGLITLFVQI